MKKILFLLLFTPMFGHSQNEKGIHWITNLSWDEVKQKAKQENKYIFIDCYATWCGPCKLMDKDVYTDEKVGVLLNDKFISLRLQFDSTINDIQSVRNWYSVASTLNSEYKLAGYPSFLFFSPDNRIVHRDLGYKTPDQFIELAQNALNPDKQYYRLLTEYQSGKRDIKDMKNLALQSRAVNEKLAIEVAEEYVRSVSKDSLFSNGSIHFLANFQRSPAIINIIKEYKTSYLDRLSSEDMLKKENLFVMSKFPSLLSSKDQYFNLFYKKGKGIDSIISNQGFSDWMVRNVIRKEEIYSILYTAENKPAIKKADWEKIKSIITDKYNSVFAESLVSETQPVFYKLVGDWKSYSEVFEKRIEKYTPTVNGSNLSLYGDAWGLNGAAWDVFKGCNDKRILKKALRWSSMAVKLDSLDVQILDTRANLLYKLKKVKDAISQETAALKLDDANANKQGKLKGLFHDKFIDTINRMKDGLPTWSITKK